MTYIIAEPCVDVLDKACIEECPVDCIYEGNRMLYIHPDECVDCGACEPGNGAVFDLVVRPRAGSGLPWFVRRGVEIDGSIELDSELGRGTRFTVTIPIRDLADNRPIAG